ncbi:MAG: hypothetical protein KF681_17315 [Bdellovibrionaceae bacterium]|nr:hypothetical protein [Pseudobdellovibrionaceae bacterium]
MLTNPIFRYRFFLGLELAVVVAVIMIFKFIEDRTVAGTVAGMTFLISTTLVMVVEWLQARRLTWTLAGGAIFMALSVLPILIIRSANWGLPFEEAEFMGIRGAWLHKISNYVFLLFLVGIFISLQKERIRQLKRRQP